MSTDEKPSEPSLDPDHEEPVGDAQISHLLARYAPEKRSARKHMRAASMTIGAKRPSFKASLKFERTPSSPEQEYTLDTPDTPDPDAADDDLLVFDDDVPGAGEGEGEEEVNYHDMSFRNDLDDEEGGEDGSNLSPEARIEHLRDLLAEREAKLRKAVSIGHQVFQEMKWKEKEAKEVEMQKKRMQKKLVRLREKYDGVRSDNAILEDALEMQRSERADALARSQEAEEELRRVRELAIEERETARRLEMRVTRITSEFEAVLVEKARMKEALHEATGNVETGQRRVDLAQKRVEVLLGRLSKSKEASEGAKKRIEEMEKQSADVESLRKAREAAETAAKELAEKKKLLEEELEAARFDSASAEKHYGSRVRELADVRAALSERVSELEREREEALAKAKAAEILAPLSAVPGTEVLRTVVSRSSASPKTPRRKRSGSGSMNLPPMPPPPVPRMLKKRRGRRIKKREELVPDDRDPSPGEVSEVLQLPEGFRLKLAHKICIVGNTGVGKTSIFHRFLNGMFEPTSPTISFDERLVKYVPMKPMTGTEESEKVEEEGEVQEGEGEGEQSQSRPQAQAQSEGEGQGLVPQEPIYVRLNDTAGQERFASLSAQYFRKTRGLVVVFDLSDMISFLRLRYWLDLAAKYIDEGCVVLLLGNKADKKKLVVHEEEVMALIRDYALQHTMLYFKSSARKNFNIRKSILAFIEIIQLKFARGFSDSKKKKKKKDKTVNLEDGTKKQKKWRC